MRRLFQAGTLLLLLATALAPLFEFFDRWDAPGLGNDSEMIAFCLILVLCLLLAVCKLLLGLAQRQDMAAEPMDWPERRSPLQETAGSLSRLIVPPILISLRI